MRVAFPAISWSENRTTGKMCIRDRNRAQELTKQLEYHNNLYYNQDDPEISVMLGISCSVIILIGVDVYKRQGIECVLDMHLVGFIFGHGNSPSLNNSAAVSYTHLVNRISLFTCIRSGGRIAV